MSENAATIEQPEKMRIRMIINKNGYPPEGEVLSVSPERAERWCLEKGLSEFVDKKDRVTIKKKMDETKRAIALADKKLNKELDKIERGEGV